LLDEIKVKVSNMRRDQENHAYGSSMMDDVTNSRAKSLLMSSGPYVCKCLNGLPRERPKETPMSRDCWIRKWKWWDGPSDPGGNIGSSAREDSPVASLGLRTQYLFPGCIFRCC
jgi:hypothetical protein